MGNSTYKAGLSDGQFEALVVTERVNSCLSLLGIFFIIGTFLFHKSFNKPINRLIFFATWGNLGTNVASLISGNGPMAGAEASICQFQAFLVQMFLGVDAYWAVCMAINVYLAIFRGYTVERLRGLDMRYLLICYGASFIPALVFLFITSPHPIYGPAVIWCWISIKWDWLRLVILYAIVWLAIALASVIYTCAFVHIYRKSADIKPYLNPLNEGPFPMTTVTTEVSVHTERIDDYLEDCKTDVGSVSPDSEFTRMHSVEMPGNTMASYSIHIEGQEKPARPLPAVLRMRELSRKKAAEEKNAEAWLYARVAFLFFFALLITWVPSSINRIYALAQPDKINFGLNYAASFVFPLQGFWNVIVYIVTSQTACRKLWADVQVWWRGSVDAVKNPVPTGRMGKMSYMMKPQIRLGSKPSLASSSIA